LFIIALGLGGSGNNYDSLNPGPAVVPEVYVSLDKINSENVIPNGLQFQLSTLSPEPTLTVLKPIGGSQESPRPNGGLQGRQKRQIIVLPDNRRCPHNDRNGQICSHIPGIIIIVYPY
jgi:hypothetical protein